MPIFENGETGLSVRTKINNAITQIEATGKQYATVAAFAADVTAGYTAPDGAVVWVGLLVASKPLGFVADSSATVTGLPAGWVPFGDVTPNHFADNATPGTTDMTVAMQRASDYGDTPGFDLLGQNYLISDAVTVTGRNTAGEPEAIRIKGAGKKLSNIIQSDPTKDWLLISKGGDLKTGWLTGEISGFGLLSQVGNFPSRSDEGAGLRMRRCLSMTVENIYMDAPTFPIVCENSAQNNFSRIYCRNNLRTAGQDAGSVFTFGPGPGGRSFGNFIDNCEAQSGQAWEVAIDVTGADGVYVTNCHLNNARTRVYARPTGVGYSDKAVQILITNTYFDGDLADGDGFAISATTPAVSVAVAASAVNTSTDRITATAHGIADGQPVQITTSGTLPSGISAATNYWVGVVDANTIQLATSVDNWRNGVWIDITSQGTGTHTLTDTPIVVISGIQMTGGFLRRGNRVLYLTGTLSGLSVFEDCMFTGVEVQDFTGTWINLFNANLTDPKSQIQNFTFTGNTFEDGPANATDNLNLFAISGKNITITGNTIQGNWTDAGVAPFSVTADSDRILIASNNIDVPRASHYTIDENATLVMGPLSGNNYASVQAFAADVTAGYTARNGTVITVGKVQFMADNTATVTGLPVGWVPFGDVTPNHFADNNTPGTTNMRTALVNAWAYTDDVNLLSESYLISGATVSVGDGKRLTGAGWTSGYGGGTTKGSIIVENKTTAGNVFQILGSTSAFSDRARTMFKDVGFVSASSKILTDLTGTVVNLISLKNTFLNVFENCLFTDLNVHEVLAGDATGSQNGVIFKGGQVTSIGDARAGFAGITGRYTYGHGINLSLIPDSEINGTFIELCGRYGVRLGSNCRAIGVFNDLCWRGYELNGERAQVIGGGCKWHQQNGFYFATDAKDWTVSNVNVIGNNYSNRVGPNENFAFRLTTGNTGWLISDIFAVDALSAGHPSKTDLQNFIHLGALGNTGTIDGARIGNPASGGTNIYDPFSNIPAGNIAIDLRPGTGSTPILVASLPTAATAGRGSRYFVSDASATAFASVVAGGGANAVPVYSDGTNWRIG